MLGVVEWQIVTDFSKDLNTVIDRVVQSQSPRRLKRSARKHVDEYLKHCMTGLSICCWELVGLLVRQWLCLLPASSKKAGRVYECLLANWQYLRF
jgi:hypothetical protein